MRTDYLETLNPLLRSFRAEILEKFGNIENDLKSDGTVVTELDRSIEKRIREKLENTYPYIGFHGEEFGRSGPEDKYWLIDPIDGTKNFIRGIEQIGTIVGLVENGEVVFVAIYNPINDKMYHAYKGSGAWCDDRRITVVERKIGNTFIESSMLLHSRGNLMQSMLEKHHTTIIRIHGSAFKQMLISEGKIDGIINLYAGGSSWDYAPGIMLAEEAGAVVTIFDGKSKLNTSNFAMLSKTVNDEIIEDLKSLWPQ